MDPSVARDFSLDGRVALVTGAAGGIGTAIATRLALAGADVAIADLDGDRATSAAARIATAAGTRVIGLRADVSDDTEVAALVQRVRGELGAVDILVNNAGIALSHEAQDFPLADWDRTLAVNLRSAFVCSQAVHAAMRERGGGKIVCIGSMYASFGAPTMPAYAASKGGVVQLTKSLAVAWAPHNIQVNAVLPGFIDTALSAQGRKDIPGMDAEVVARTPAGRWGEPSDVAGAALFLVSRAADFVTGATIAVDGGYAAR